MARMAAATGFLLAGGAEMACAARCSSPRLAWRRRETAVTLVSTASTAMGKVNTDMVSNTWKDSPGTNSL